MFGNAGALAGNVAIVHRPNRVCPTVFCLPKGGQDS